MPWVDKDKCVGCGICVSKCPASAISMKGEKAEIDMNKCIRCGKCHDFCPQNAVIHDSERIPMEVEKNLKKTRDLMKNFGTREERKAFLERMERHFNKEKTVAERSIEKIKNLMKGENGG
ncbi:MAG: 4Fe-4S binding protein [Candidatus Aenigmarchaeota archaeon]|nr:4Fe-4S binding protein [Candidatus Aenigmarchaeota archaeon]